MRDGGRQLATHALHLGVAPLAAAALSAADGLSPRRCAAAAGVSLGGGLLVDALLGPGPLTHADQVTRFRTSLVAATAGRLLAGRIGVGDPAADPRRTVPLATALTVAISLDAVDGFVARRTDTATERGARFDLEADAAAVAVLSVATAHLTRWAIVPGALRYAFGAARAVTPALRGPLEKRPSRRAIAGASMAVLAVTTWPQVPAPAARLLTVGAAGALLGSFGRDTVSLLRGRGTRA